MAEFKNIVLTVDDDTNICELLAIILQESGYDVVQFCDASSALEWLKTHKPALIISDITMPGLSGTQFCQLLKKDPALSAIPVIMLTSFGDERHKVDALQTGADDYLVKPFSNAELTARVEALLRRCYHRGGVNRVLVSGSLVLDLDTGDVLAGRKKVELLPKEFSLLSTFLSHKGRILSYSFLAEAVWGLDAIATKATIKVPIHRLKSKLGEYAGHIKPALGLGYKWTKN